jgi:hypothetical protein
MIPHDQLRLQNWRLKVLQEAHSSGNVARTCRRYGISRKTFYLWRSRYNAEDVTSAAKLLHYCDFTCYPLLVGLHQNVSMLVLLHVSA